MKIRNWSILPLLIPAFASLVLSSCPLPITERIVAALEDEYAPVISITTPAINNDVYYSLLRVEGSVSDGAFTRSDGKGSVTSLSFETNTSGSSYRGGIIVNGGDAIQDPDAGDVEIHYNDPSNGDFWFELDTSVFTSDLEISFTATDLKGNVQTDVLVGGSYVRELVLKSSGGPEVEITGPASDDRFFSDVSVINLEGTLSDSLAITDSIAELASVKFIVGSLGEMAHLILDPDATGVQSEPIPFLSSELRVVGSENKFYCTFTPPDSGMNDTTTLTIEVEDRNGNTKSDTITMYYNDGGPNLNITSPAKSGVYHTSLRTDEPDILLTFALASAGSVITKVFYQYSNNGTPFGGEQVLWDYNPDTGIFTGILLPTYSLWMNPDLFSGDLGVTVTAEAENGMTTSYSRTVPNDTTGPTFQSPEWKNGSDTVQYANGGDTVVLEFTPYDSEAGVNHSTIQLSGTDVPANEAAQNTELDSYVAGESTYYVTFDFANSATQYPDGEVQFSISASDNMNISDSLTPTEAQLFYYHEAPSAPGLTFVNNTESGETAYLDADDTLRITRTDGRVLNSASSTLTLLSDEGGSYSVNLEDDVHQYDVDISSTTLAGNLSYTYDYTDAAGNQTNFGGTEFPTTFYVDGDVPDVQAGSFTLTPTGTAINGDTVTISATCVEDGSGLTGDPTLILTLDGTPVSPDATPSYNSGTGAFSAAYTVGPGLLGTLSATLSMTDAAGNASGAIAADNDVSVDSVLPEVTISSFHNGSGGSTAGIGDTLTVVFSSNKAVSGNPVVTFQNPSGSNYSISAGNIVYTDTDSPDAGLNWTAEYTLVDSTGAGVPDIDDPDIDVKVLVSDVLGNSDDATDNGVSVDNIRPIVTAASGDFYVDDPADSPRDTIAGEGEDIVLEFTTSEALSTNPDVVFSLDGTNVDATVSDTDSGAGLAWKAVYNVPVAGSYDGDVTASITATDDHGNTDGDSGTETGVTVDNIYPVVSISSPTTGTSAAKNTSIDITVTVTETNLNPPVIVRQRNDLSGTTDTTASDNGDGTYTASYPLPSSTGNHRIEAIAVDSAGNRTVSDDITINVTD